MVLIQLLLPTTEAAGRDGMATLAERSSVTERLRWRGQPLQTQREPDRIRPTERSLSACWARRCC